MNELPDLAPKIQVGMFNVLEERDVQIRGFPIRLNLDLCMVFGQPGGLHQPRPDRHAAEGPHRLGDPHALSADARAWHGHQRRRMPGPTVKTVFAQYFDVKSFRQAVEYFEGGKTLELDADAPARVILKTIEDVPQF
jgi:hypothetical protein